MSTQAFLALAPDDEKKRSGFRPWKHVDPPTGGTGWQLRDFHGYCQAREWVNGEPGDWQFDVTGFYTDGGEDGECCVLMWDGSEKDVPITSRATILIRGRYYGRRYWSH